MFPPRLAKQHTGTGTAAETRPEAVFFYFFLKTIILKIRGMQEKGITFCKTSSRENTGRGSFRRFIRKLWIFYTPFQRINIFILRVSIVIYYKSTISDII